MKKVVKVTQYIEVEIDEAKFNEEFIQDFKEYMFNFDTIEEHISYLAELFAKRVVINESSFIDGYGIASDMGIKFSEESICVEIVKEEV